MSLLAVVKVYLGVDYGERRIGLARAEAGEPALPWQTLVLHNTSEAVAAVAATAQAIEGLSAVVVGLPRNLDGDDTAQTTKVRTFAANLAEQLTVEVVLQDEATTSSLAKKRLEARGKSFQAADIDAEAAAIILQDYLDNL